MLDIEKEANGSQLTVKLNGRLDTITAPDLDQELKDSLADVTDLVLDFKDLEYISSAGLRVLLSAQKEMNKKGSMELINVSEGVNEIFEVTGFIDILTIK